MLPGLLILEGHTRNRMLLKDRNKKGRGGKQEVSVGVTSWQTEITGKFKCRNDWTRGKRLGRQEGLRMTSCPSYKNVLGVMTTPM